MSGAAMSGGDLGVGSGGADMDAIMANNEMNRRSMATGLPTGLDFQFLSMGNEDQFQPMVSPTGYNQHSMENAQQQLVEGIPTTLDGVLEMSNQPIPSDMGLIGYGGMSGPELQSLYSPSTGSMTPRQSDHSPGMMSSATSIPPTPASAMGPPQGMSGEFYDRWLNQRLNRVSDPVASDLPMDKPVFQGPAPSKFADNVYSSSGFDMLDILVWCPDFPIPRNRDGAGKKKWC